MYRFERGYEQEVKLQATQPKGAVGGAAIEGGGEEGGEYSIQVNKGTTLP